MSHAYANAGTFNVTMSVATTNNQYGTATATVTVSGTGAATFNGATEQVALYAVCNNVSVTWPTGTGIATVVNAIAPAGSLAAIWRFNNAAQSYAGYSPTPGAPNDLNTVNRAEPVFICMNVGGTFTRPLI